MAVNYTGNNGDVEIQGTDIVAGVMDFTLSRSVSTIDNSELDAEWDEHVNGAKSWSGSINCYWDATDTLGQEALQLGASVALALRPLGAGSGLPEYVGQATVESIENSHARNAIITASFSFKGDGAVVQQAQP